MLLLASKPEINVEYIVHPWAVWSSFWSKKAAVNVHTVHLPPNLYGTNPMCGACVAGIFSTERSRFLRHSRTADRGASVL